MKLKPDLLSFWDLPAWIGLIFSVSWTVTYGLPLYVPLLVSIVPIVSLLALRYPYLTFDGERCTYRNLFSSGSFDAADVTDLLSKETALARFSIEILWVEASGRRMRITATRGRSKAERARVARFMEPIIRLSPERARLGRRLAEYPL